MPLRALVTTSECCPDSVRTGPFHGEVLLLDQLQSGIASQPSERLGRTDTGATPEDLCYVIYTSGTTGRPKGGGRLSTAAPATWCASRESSSR
jgi:acyl-coenzyme A synthetase/AMP-(fatty) acid ligase